MEPEKIKVQDVEPIVIIDTKDVDKCLEQMDDGFADATQPDESEEISILKCIWASTEATAELLGKLIIEVKQLNAMLSNVDRLKRFEHGIRGDF
jgi:hypothetical protein